MKHQQLILSALVLGWAAGVAVSAGSTSNSLVESADAPSNTQDSGISAIGEDLPSESKFALAIGGSHSTSSISGDIPFGIATAPFTLDLEIYNGGGAPLQIKSISLPDGFSTTASTGESSVESQQALPLPITLSTDEAGLKSGDLKIKYLDNNGKEATHSVYLYGTSAPNAQWVADFGSESSNVIWPIGTYAGKDIISNYGNQQYGGGTSGLGTDDNYLTFDSWGKNDNKFITPLLTSDSEGKIYFSIATDYFTTGYKLKIYVSSDRSNWGDPVEVIEANNSVLEDYRFHGFSIDTPAGDFYVAFEIEKYMKLNDIAATAARKDVAHDICIVNFTQPESLKSGEEFKTSVKVMHAMDTPADSYKIVYYLGDEALAELPGIDLKASRNEQETFTFSVSKEVESTVTLPGKIVFKFTDGTKIESTPRDLTITNEPGFVFNVPGFPDSNTSSLSSPIDFGKINKLDTKQSFEIFNYGTAPLNVTSITVPEGFSTSIENATIAGGQRQNVDITFSANTPDTYSGQLSIKYVTSEGEQEYTQEIKGILLDPEKWYANFDAKDSDGNIIPGIPESAVYQKNIDFKDQGSNHALYCESDASVSDRMFITPRLKAEAGETFCFDARCANVFGKGGVNVFAAPTREALLSPDEEGNYPDRILLTELSNQEVDDDHHLDHEYFLTFNVTIEEAGEYYIGFEPYGRTYIDEIYGLSEVTVAHDWILEGANIPTEAMQNVDKAATLLLRNVGAPEEAKTYTVTAYVDGEATSYEGSEIIPTIQNLNDKPSEIAINFRSPKVGTFPVYLEISAGDVTLTSDPVEVTFEEEYISSDVVVGTPYDISYNGPLNFNYNDSEFISLYTPEELGLADGDKISSIALKGMGKTDFTSRLKVYYEWTDDETEEYPRTTTGYEPNENMIKYFEDEYEWPNEGDNETNMITLNFDEPLEYAEGKSLRLLVSTSNQSYIGSGNFGFKVSASSANCYWHRDDRPAYEFDSSWTAANKPVLYISLVPDNRTVSGEVVAADGTTPVANATVRLISNDGDNIQYAAQTNDNGEYSVKVVQQNRVYDMEVIGTDGTEDFMKDVSVAEESMIVDFSLLSVCRVADDSEHTGAIDNAVVYLQKSLNPGYNAVAFPVTLEKEEVESIFGKDAVVFEFDCVSTDGAATVVNFMEVFDKNMVAGNPYLIYISEPSEKVGFKIKRAVSELKTTSKETTDFLATDRPTPIAEKMFVLNDDNFIDITKQRAVTELPAFSGYIKAPNATSLSFTTNDDVQTGIEEAEIVGNEEDQIYDLNGLRVKNPEKGIYIINGKTVLVK